MLKGRLGLDTARIPHVDRHGLLWVRRGRLFVEAGTLRFVTAGDDDLEPGIYDIPFQMLSVLLIAPGTTVTHDVLRLLARHGTGLVAVGEDGVRFYASMPFGPDNSALSRRQVRAWADPDRRRFIARKMYAWRMGTLPPNADIEVLRGIEGARARKMYPTLAQQYGLTWKGRRYDRANPDSADLPNQAINHVATVVQSAAMIAVALTGTIPQLGFIHEDSGRAFALDIADLYRDEFTLPVAFGAVRKCIDQRRGPLERVTRKLAGENLRSQKLVPRMIDRIKDLFNADDPGGDK